LGREEPESNDPNRPNHPNAHLSCRNALVGCKLWKDINLDQRHSGGVVEALQLRGIFAGRQRGDDDRFEGKGGRKTTALYLVHLAAGLPVIVAGNHLASLIEEEKLRIGENPLHTE